MGICFFENRKFMAGVLYDSIIYGPIRSRRFGISLGINVLPEDTKICTFDCIYCEVGWNNTQRNGHKNHLFHSREDIAESLEARIIDLKERHMRPDSITFSGNGEPTLHPDFPGIIRDIQNLRDIHLPDSKVTVLSNSTTLHNQKVFNALKQVENNIMKLDAGSEYLFRIINQPAEHIQMQDILSNLKKFNGDLHIQSMFLRGTHRGEYVDNTRDEEVKLWLEHIRKINPHSVMLYSIDRATPNHTIEKLPHNELENITQKVRALGIEAHSFS